MRIPENFAHVQHFFEGTGVPTGAAVTYGVENQAFFTTADLAEELHAEFATFITARMSSAVSLRTTRVKEGPNDLGPFAEFTDVVPGTDAGTATPPNTCMLLEKRTNLGGRQGQGRMFLPGLDEGDVDAGGLLAAAKVDAMNSGAATWLAALDAQGTPMVLLHSTLLAPTPVTSLVCDVRAATQRRRLRR